MATRVKVPIFIKSQDALIKEDVCLVLLDAEKGLSLSSALSRVTLINKGRRPLYGRSSEKPTKKAEAKGDQRGRTQKVHVESGSGHRVGEVGHPDWNEPNGTENVSSRWTRPSPTSPPNFNKVPFQPRDMEATGPRKGLEGCCDCGEHINFSNLSSNIKACGFIFQRRLTTILVPSQGRTAKKLARSR